MVKNLLIDYIGKRIDKHIASPTLKDIDRALMNRVYGKKKSVIERVRDKLSARKAKDNLDKTATILTPKYPDSSPGVPKQTSIDPDEADQAKRRAFMDTKKAHKRYREKYKYRTMGHGLETEFFSGSTNPSTNSKDMPLRGL